MQKFDASKNYYAELGLGEDASKEDIDRAFRSEARKRHPDGGGSEEEMKSLNEAHDVLSDPETRKAYDAERAPPRIAYGSSAAFDPDESGVLEGLSVDKQARANHLTRCPCAISAK